MSVELHLARGRGDGRRMYQRVEEYDPVLRWHCRIPEPEESDPNDGDESSAITRGPESEAQTQRL